MQVFLVGGAVRDTLLGTKSEDRDYVVVGLTPAEMIGAGYSQVGADFPVFLHPETGDEYALARTEMKSGTGYNGFAVKHEPGSLNPELYNKMVDGGFEPDEEHDIGKMIVFFKSIT